MTINVIIHKSVWFLLPQAVVRLTNAFPLEGSDDKLFTVYLNSTNRLKVSLFIKIAVRITYEKLKSREI